MARRSGADSLPALWQPRRWSRGERWIRTRRGGSRATGSSTRLSHLLRGRELSIRTRKETGCASRCARRSAARRRVRRAWRAAWAPMRSLESSRRRSRQPIVSSISWLARLSRTGRALRSAYASETACAARSSAASRNPGPIHSDPSSRRARSRRASHRAKRRSHIGDTGAGNSISKPEVSPRHGAISPGCFDAANP